MDDRQYRVQLQRHRDELWVSGDPIRLKQVLCNLIQNAARYTPPGGLISISTARQDGFAQVQVSDNGIGISQDLLGQVFDLFVQG
jgi:signal transduction histidine kinase